MPSNYFTLISKKPPVSPAASLQELYNHPNSHQPADQHHQPEHRQQQTVIGAIPDARPVIPLQRVPVANPQRGLHLPPSHQIVPHTPHLPSSSATPRRRHSPKERGSKTSNAGKFLSRHTVSPAGAQRSGAGAALTGVIP